MLLSGLFCNDTATTEIDTDLHTLSLHDAPPISRQCISRHRQIGAPGGEMIFGLTSMEHIDEEFPANAASDRRIGDRAVFGIARPGPDAAFARGGSSDDRDPAVATLGA